jgi:hypothetical protein
MRRALSTVFHHFQPKTTMKRILSISLLVLGAAALGGCNKSPAPAAGGSPSGTTETPSASPMASSPASSASAP